MHPFIHNAIGHKLRNFANCQGRNWGCWRTFLKHFFTGSFDDAELAGTVGQIMDRVGGGVLSDRVGHEIQTAVDHFRREIGERSRQRFGDGIGQVDQHGVQQPGGPQLHLDGVFGAAVEIGQAQQPLDDGEGVFNGLITNDKFCLIRTGRLALSWWRRPLRLRNPATATYLHEVSVPRGGAYEAVMACASIPTGEPGWSAAVGSSLPAPAALGDADRAGGDP